MTFRDFVQEPMNPSESIADYAKRAFDLGKKQGREEGRATLAPVYTVDVKKLSDEQRRLGFESGYNSGKRDAEERARQEKNEIHANVEARLNRQREMLFTEGFDAGQRHAEQLERDALNDMFEKGKRIGRNQAAVSVHQESAEAHRKELDRVEEEAFKRGQVKLIDKLIGELKTKRAEVAPKPKPCDW